ncbi:uncharacterized protein LOC135113700 isoform X2 [Scylla paramamosain]|uniref:uncharacterized protein LOC135113700 isoform X2 n=1 Tax=Scylla paramamosain TaxID=85552 RepID=UPI003083846E
MGCGRSSLASDSPKKKKKSEGDSECDSDGDSTSSGGGGGGGSGRKQQQLSNKKISESQQDFFMMLDEKIENGPDYDSETEEVERRRRLQECAQQWGTLSSSQAASPSNDVPVRLPDEDTGGSGDITEDDEEEDEPGRIPDEAVKEQYMFMGNLYTLTHIRTDSDKTEPKVDVVTVPQEEAGEDPSGGEAELGHKLNGSAVQEGNGVTEVEEVTDGMPQTKTSPRSTSRPASLILKSVFPTDALQE